MESGDLALKKIWFRKTPVNKIYCEINFIPNKQYKMWTKMKDKNHKHKALSL